MRMMNSVRIAVLAAALAAPALYAQDKRDGIAQLKDVHGNVLVSRQAGLAAGGESSRLLEGSRVITTARSDVIVVYDDGCEVRLKENQRFVVEHGKPCAVLMAQVESLLVEPSAGAIAGAGSGGSFWTLLPPAAGAAIAIEILRRDHEKQPVSPS